MANLKEIAAKTGFSLSTVSLVLRGEGSNRSIPMETQNLIYEAAKELNYRPNLSARKLRSNSDRHTIAVFWANDFRASLVFRLIQGFQTYMNETKSDYDVVIRPYEPGKLSDYAHPNVILSYSGIIFCNTSQEDFDYLKSIPMITPLVLYNRKSENISCVFVDDEALGRASAERILAKGIKESVIVMPQKKYQYVTTRVDSFRSVFENAGGKCTLCEPDDYTSVAAYNAIKNMDWGRKKRGLFCVGDTLLFGILLYFGEAGLNINELAEIVTIGGDLQMLPAFPVRASMIKIPLEEMGYNCLSLLEKEIVDSTCPKTQINLPFDFIDV